MARAVEKKVSPVEQGGQRGYQLEVAKTFYRLGSWWQAEITKAYDKFEDRQQVVDVFRITKKYNRKWVPQSMVASALVTYAEENNSWSLSPVDFEKFLDDQFQEYISVKTLQQEFEKNKGRKEFRNYQRYLQRTRRRAPTSIKEIRETKWYSADTYMFSQYLEESFAKSNEKEKEAMLAVLSTESQQAFVVYTQNNDRLSRVIALPEKFAMSSASRSSKEKVAVSNNAKESFWNISTTFERDLDRPDGPKQILETVDNSVFWAERLSDMQIKEFRSSLQWISLQMWSFLLQKHDEELPQWVTAESMKMFVDTGEAQDVKAEVFESVFKKIVLAYFVVETKKRMQEMALKEYFFLVGSLLQIWGEFVGLDESTPIRYEKDGQITMRYVTATGMSWEILIDQDGVMHVETLFWYDENGGMHFNIQSSTKIISWKLPSLTSMLARVANEKTQIIDSWSSMLQSASWRSVLQNIPEQESDQEQSEPIENNIVEIWEEDKDYDEQLQFWKIISEKQYLATMLTENDETSRRIVEEPLKKELLLIQSVDRIVAMLQQISSKQWLPIYNERLLDFIRTGQGSLTQEENPELASLFFLRESILKSPSSQAQKIVEGLQKVEDVYANASVKKENYPFILSDQLEKDKSEAGSENSWKQTVRSFLSFFCIGKQPLIKFDTNVFANAVTKMQQQNNTTGDLSHLLPTQLWVPLTSLYYQQNSELLKEEEKVLSQSKIELQELSWAVESSILEKQLNQA